MNATVGQAVMTELERKCRKIVQKHRGKENAISRTGLSIFLGVTDRQARILIHNLILVHRIPVCTDRKGGGYFLAETESEKTQEYDCLKGQALSILNRASVIKKFNFEKIQMELDLK